MIVNKFPNGSNNKKIPAFTYTGTYTTVDDGADGWRIKFLTSGTLKLKSRRIIDVFLVGGGSSGAYGDGYNSNGNGGCGGAGGYTTTAKNINATAGGTYNIVIGAGGAAVGPGANSIKGNAGSASYAFGFVANGGSATFVYPDSKYFRPPNGGSGGGWGAGGAIEDHYFNGSQGGSNGGNGYQATLSGNVITYTEIQAGMSYGQGQNSSTREFGEPSGALYAGGGGGGGCYQIKYELPNDTYIISTPGNGGAGGGGKGAPYNGNAVNGTANTGGGGGGGSFYTNNTSYRHKSGAGGSGIVIIRNHRE